MANLSLGYGNLVDDADTALAVDNERSDLPGDNLADTRLAKRWKSSGSTVTIQVRAFGSARTARQLFLGNTNIPINYDVNGDPTTTLRLRASDTDFTTGDKLDTSSGWSADSVWGSLFWDFGQDVRAKFWQLDISDSTFPSTDVAAGRLALLPVVRPAVNIAANYRLGVEPLVDVTVTPGGQEYRYERDGGTGPHRRRLEIEWRELTADEALATLLRHVDRFGAADVLAVIDPDNVPTLAGADGHDHRGVVWGRMAEVGPALRRYPESARYAKRYAIVEAK